LAKLHDDLRALPLLTSPFHLIFARIISEKSLNISRYASVFFKHATRKSERKTGKLIVEEPLIGDGIILALLAGKIKVIHRFDC